MRHLNALPLFLLQLLLQLLLLTPAVAGTLVLDDQPLDALDLVPYIDGYTGQQRPADSLAASRLADADYTPVQGRPPLGIMETRWFRLAIRNDSSSPRALVLDFNQALYSRIDWLAGEGATQKRLVTGQDFPYTSRDLAYNYFAFRLDIPPGATEVVNFSIYTPYAAAFVPRLSDGDIFLEGLPQAWQFTGSVVGMLYAVALFLLIYCVRMPGIGAAHAMLGQVAFSMLSVLYLAGVVQRWLPDGETPWRDMAYILIHGPQGICYSLAVRSFFQTRLHYRWLDRGLVAMVVAAVLLLALLPLASIHPLIVSILAVNFLMMVFSVAVAVKALYRRQAGTSLFSIGLILFVLLAIISVLGSAGVLPVSFLTRYSYDLGLTLQADFLFLAIAMRIFAAEREQLALESEMLRMRTEMQARSEFVERVTHDIKSPLTAVLGAEQLLRDSPPPADLNRYLDVIRTSCSMVISAVDDILTHARLKKTTLVLQQEPFNLPALLGDIEQALRSSQHDSRLAFEVSVHEELPEYVTGDKLRISQVLHNLLNNAFKFTDEGRVRMTVDLVEKQPAQAQVRFVIEDTGIGMSEEFRSQAFESYAREDSRTGYRPGFGLGLAICRQLVDSMGGTIEIASETGRGTRLTVVLPIVVQDWSV